MAEVTRINTRQRTSEEDDSESPEALFISAMLEEGEFDPGKWRIQDDDLACFQPLWRFCCDHQQRAGRAPSFSLIRQRFPDFELTTEIDPNWAASKLREASASRVLRTKMRAALGKLKDDDLFGAYAELEGYMVPVGTSIAGVDGFDPKLGTAELELNRIPVPWDSLGRATGGMAAGDVWLLGLRLGQGKTSTGCAMVARALRDGFSVIYFSMEMPAHQITHKIHCVLANRDKELMGALKGGDNVKREAAILTLAERTPGKLKIYDPGIGVCEPRQVADALSEADLVVVDHSMLLKLRGKAAISDWRIAAEISNQVKTETLRHNSRLLMLQQVNRMGETSSPTRTPKTSELSGADTFGQDADIIITGTRYSTSVMTLSAEKVRLGPQPKWYIRFQPDLGRFDQITREQAIDIAAQDEDNKERANSR